MKKIMLGSMLLFHLTVVCGQNEPTLRLSELNLDSVRAFFSKDAVNENELVRDFKGLDSILNQDIGEGAMLSQLKALEKDSAAYYALVDTKPAELRQQKLIMKRQYVEAHPDSYVSLYELEDNYGMYSVESYSAAYAKLSDRLKMTHASQGIRDRIAEWKKQSPAGQQAPDFTRKDQYGKTIKLSDYRGKLVLLDFWGSWCGACRQSHPHLKEVYAAYKDKGLEIVSVANQGVHGASFVKGKADWLAAIKKDGVNWVHVLNEDGTDDMDIVKAYGIDAYPTKFLIDRNGKILLRISDMMNDEIDQQIRSRLSDGKTAF